MKLYIALPGDEEGNTRVQEELFTYGYSWSTGSKHPLNLYIYGRPAYIKCGLTTAILSWGFMMDRQLPPTIAMEEARPILRNVKLRRLLL